MQKEDKCVTRVDNQARDHRRGILRGVITRREIYPRDCTNGVETHRAIQNKLFLNAKYSVESIYSVYEMVEETCFVIF